MIIRELQLSDVEAALPQLAALLVDAVDSNAGVSFMHPLAMSEALEFWQGKINDIASGATHHFVAEEDGKIIGTVMFMKAWAPNQPHRGEIAKMLVHSQHRRNGIGLKLLQAVEAKAHALGLTLITFDSVAHGSSEQFYKKAGYVVAGYYPRFALSPQGEMDDAALFYKQLKI